MLVLSNRFMEFTRVAFSCSNNCARSSVMICLFGVVGVIGKVDSLWNRVIVCFL